MTPWPSYHLDELVFKNGKSIRTRPLPQMRYCPSDQSVVIVSLAAKDFAAMLRNQGSALRGIYYWIAVREGERGVKLWSEKFHHPFPAGTFVILDEPPADAPARSILIRNEEGKTLFSEKFTVDQITLGEVPSRQRAFQFLEK